MIIHRSIDKLQTILNDDVTLRQEDISETLNIAQLTISGHLKHMGKIQNYGKWTSHELNGKPKNHL